MIEVEEFINDYNRLSGLVIEQNDAFANEGKTGYIKAVQQLNSLSIKLHCGEKINFSASLQAALLTSLNTGKRAFLGGVYVAVPDNIPCLLPWPQVSTFNEVIEQLEGILIEPEEQPSLTTLLFGLKATSNNHLEVICNGWQGGVRSYNDSFFLNEGPDFALGGILAGSIGIALAFQKALSLKPYAFEESTGLSLWRPDLNWLDEEANGPVIHYFPDKIWLLGLGHLGQAYVWTLGLLPFKNNSQMTIYLQDFDVLVKGNYEAGLLCEKELIGKKKARVCAEWLEKRGFATTIIEKSYNQHTVRDHNDPSILLCGLDSLETRKHLRISDFSAVLDCGLGGTAESFDSITIHNFPAYNRSPELTWQDVSSVISNKNIKKMMEKEFGCGIVKGIATSFVGAFSSSLMISEVLRGYHNGIKSKIITLSLRNLNNRAVVTDQYYQQEMLSGFVEM